MPPQLDLCAVEAQTLGREGLVGRGRYGRKEIMLNTDKEVFLKFLATEPQISLVFPELAVDLFGSNILQR